MEDNHTWKKMYVEPSYLEKRYEGQSTWEKSYGRHPNFGGRVWRTPTLGHNL